VVRLDDRRIVVERWPLGLRVPRDVWNSWQLLSGNAPPYLVPEWFTLTARAFALDALLLAARRGDELIAALALRREGRVLFALATDHAPRTDLVGSPGALAEMWRVLRDDRSWDALTLSKAPRGSPLVDQMLPLAERDGFTVCIHPSVRSPYLPLSGFDAKTNAALRDQLDRGKRALGDVAFERITTFDRAALDEAFAIEALGSRRAGRTPIRDDATLRRFYYGLARTFARRGGLSLSFLRVAGKRVAFHFALEDGRVQCLLELGHDPALAEHDPRALLVREACADAERRGLAELDMLGADDTWKLRWSTLVREHVDLFVYRASMRGRILHAAREVVRPRARHLVRTLSERLRSR
jgi:CelD/BcsL family acetyltransferase involved in cellulose biosynthesis